MWNDGFNPWFMCLFCVFVFDYLKTGQVAPVIPVEQEGQEFKTGPVHTGKFCLERKGGLARYLSG